MTSETSTAAWREQVSAAAQRYADSAAQRCRIEQRRRTAESDVVDSEEQIVARADRLFANGEVPPEVVTDLAAGEPVGRITALERVIGQVNDLQAANFLGRGGRAAATVARISLADNGREVPIGTGSLVSPQLLLTNHHVLPTAQSAARVIVEFRAETDLDSTPTPPVRVRPVPQDFFVTHEKLDYTLVRLGPVPGDGAPGVTFGWNPLIAEQGKIVIGEAMNVIGHPMGRLKEISIRDNRLDLQLDDFLNYSSDTEPGSSGSPVFNDQWEIVALHHCGVSAQDTEGNTLRLDGRRWQPGDGDDAVQWIANEGVRVSAILRDLRSRRYDPAQKALLDELGEQAGLDVVGPQQDIGVVSQPEPIVGRPEPVVGQADPVVVPPEPAVVRPEPAVVRPEPVVPPQPAVAQEESVPRLRGLRGNTTAFGGRRSLLFLHGRGQQGRDPGDLRRVWTAGLNKGLTLADLAAIDAADAYFPYYGDRLATSLEHRESTGATDSALYESLVTEAAEAAGMPSAGAETDAVPEEGLRGIGSGLLGRVHDQLGWLAARSGLDTFLISAIFSDVAAYLGNDEVRKGVLETVLADTPATGELILVAHSLGTVVALDLLTELPRELDVRLLVTAGSPLGLDAVYRKLLTGGATRPERVGNWLNTFYAGDPVAIGCPLRPVWGAGVHDAAVENSKEHAHDIDEYLAHPVVAATIGRAVRA
ncbi:trypsin-like peptidase domain-containing protein [Nocardia sp. FBN12]|uniref:trypsin-like peptidase domain-containing protein n=1 Tax=Nocardia sp. FBN12 TaxID=3419766 RepID=UPI003D01DCEF